MATETINRIDGLESLADLLKALGGISPDRVRLHPALGTATEADVLALEREGIVCELIDGVLVEKVMGFYESWVASVLIIHLGSYLRRNSLGAVAAGDGQTRLLSGLVRIPDVSFVRWDRIPGGKLVPGKFLEVAPDLAVEVLSPGNTEGEISRKLRELFAAGTRLAWVIEPELKNVRVCRSADEFQVLRYNDTLDGGDVLPGFSLSLKEFFDEVENKGP
jgi:Uma2 family endonuclease